MTTHAELVAAVEKARPGDAGRLTFGGAWANERDNFCDTLAAILNLHHHDYGVVSCGTCMDGVIPSSAGYWPCPTVGLVADALRKMGAL